jgi:hypothetical protein
MADDKTHVIILTAKSNFIGRSDDFVYPTERGRGGTSPIRSVGSDG